MKLLAALCGVSVLGYFLTTRTGRGSTNLDPTCRSQIRVLRVQGALTAKLCLTPIESGLEIHFAPKENCND